MRDEPKPTGKGSLVFPELLKTIIKVGYWQIIKGRRKYGTFLRTDNGRHAANDAWQEYWDLGMYVKQLELENEKLKQKIQGLENPQKRSSWVIPGRLFWKR